MPYGQNKYGELIYGSTKKNDDEKQLGRTIDLVKYLPQNHQGENVKKLLNLAGNELGLIEYFNLKLADQASVPLADFGLADWEEMLAIPFNPTAGEKERREIIRARLRGQGTTTKEMIKTTAEAFSRGEVEIIEHPSEYRFTVKFIGVKGIPSNMQAFIEMLNQIKPAHLTYDFSYTYMVWELIDETWESASAYSWKGLETYEG